VKRLGENYGIVNFFMAKNEFFVLSVVQESPLLMNSLVSPFTVSVFVVRCFFRVSSCVCPAWNGRRSSHRALLFHVIISGGEVCGFARGEV